MLYIRLYRESCTLTDCSNDIPPHEADFQRMGRLKFSGPCKIVRTYVRVSWKPEVRMRHQFQERDRDLIRKYVANRSFNA